MFSSRFKPDLFAWGVVAMLGCAAPVWAAPPQGSVTLSGTSIDWHVASKDAEVDRAFETAKRDGKPIFLYWGAVWCPPCNQVKAVLFSRADFAERSRAFVPVYVDGDKPGAQKVASRFHVSGYPTMILFKPDGTEITRLPGEVDPERYMLTLSAALNAQVPVRELVQRAVQHQSLSPEQWRLLAYYSWETDQQQVFRTAEVATKLAQLAELVPADQPQVRDRLMLKSVAANADADSPVPASTRTRDLTFIRNLLASPSNAGAMGELLAYYATSVVKYLSSDPASKADLATKWDALLDARLKSGVSKVDAVDVLDARVDLWKLAAGSDRLPQERQRLILQTLGQIVAGTPDRYERQAVVPAAAHVLASAGLLNESDELLRAELPRAVAPYYHMLQLAGNAKKRGDSKGALGWYEKAWTRSEGPATRIQWGANYISALVDLDPSDISRINLAASSLITQLSGSSETFYERNLRSLQKMATKLNSWQAQDRQRQPVVAKLRQQIDQLCTRIPARDVGRANCERVFEGSAQS